MVFSAFREYTMVRSRRHPPTSACSEQVAAKPIPPEGSPLLPGALFPEQRKATGWEQANTTELNLWSFLGQTRLMTRIDQPGDNTRAQDRATL